MKQQPMNTKPADTLTELDGKQVQKLTSKRVFKNARVYHSGRRTWVLDKDGNVHSSFAVGFVGMPLRFLVAEWRCYNHDLFRLGVITERLMKQIAADQKSKEKLEQQARDILVFQSVSKNLGIKLTKAQVAKLKKGSR